MNSKKAKAIRRLARKGERVIVVKAMQQMLDCPFRDRLHFAWEIVKGRKNRDRMREEIK